MTIELLLTILIILIIGIIVIKSIRKILSVCLLLVLLYFSYYIFFTYRGATKLAIFVETLSIESFKTEDNLITSDGKRIFDPYLKVGKNNIKEISCKTYKPVILCQAEMVEE